jgi:hypothetical protein
VTIFYRFNPRDAEGAPRDIALAEISAFLRLQHGRIPEAQFLQILPHLPAPLAALFEAFDVPTPPPPEPAPEPEPTPEGGE